MRLFTTRFCWCATLGNRSPTDQLNAPLVVVPAVGRPNDFATVDVTGAIAIIRRGEIPFSEKAHNAAAVGASGLVLVFLSSSFIENYHT